MDDQNNTIKPNSTKKKTIQFEDKEQLSEDIKRSSSPPTENREKGGILKKKSILNQENNLNLEIKTNQKEEKNEKNSQNDENSELNDGKIPLLNLNFEETSEKKPIVQGKRINSKENKKFKLKKNEINEISDKNDNIFNELDENLQKLKKPYEIQENKQESLKNENFIKTRVTQDADYIEKNLYKVLREGIDEMFLKQ